MFNGNGTNTQQQKRTKKSNTHSMVVIPKDVCRWLRWIMHDTSQIYGGAALDVQIRCSNNFCCWLCERKMRRFSSKLNCDVNNFIARRAYRGQERWNVLLSMRAGGKTPSSWSTSLFLRHERTQLNEQGLDGPLVGGVVEISLPHSQFSFSAKNINSKRALKALINYSLASPSRTNPCLTHARASWARKVESN